MNWKNFKGEDAQLEGTVNFSTTVGVAPSAYDLTGATLTWHMGSVLQPPMMTRSSTTGSNFTFGTTIGTYTLSIYRPDTTSLSATSYLHDLWLTTSGGRNYCLFVGTFQIIGVVGTL